MVAVPLATVLKWAVTVPQPWPGTQPLLCGSTVGEPRSASTAGFELGSTVQYVLCSTSVRVVPAGTLTVDPLSASLTVACRAAVVGGVVGTRIVEGSVGGAGAAGRVVDDGDELVVVGASIVRALFARPGPAHEVTSPAEIRSAAVRRASTPGSLHTRARDEEIH